MAAQSVVHRGYADPIETYSSNVMGTVHLLEAIRQLRWPCVVVNVTSDKCYANREWVWGYRENEPMGEGPLFELEGLRRACDLRVPGLLFPPRTWSARGGAASARAGNAIGGGDWTSDQLIPDLMRAFLAGESCFIRSLPPIVPGSSF
jgi:CDP-glucose 4,6-dehydratase